MALGQTEPQQTTQGQTNETQTTAPAKAKEMRPEQEQTKPQTKTETGTNVKGRAAEINRNQSATRSTTGQMNTRSNTNETNVRGTNETNVKGTNETNVRGTNETNVRGTNQTTTVNKQEFRSRHSEVFSLGRHPKDFFIERFGANHVRLIGNTYFAFVDGCWVSVDVDGFVYSQRVICAGDPDFVEVY